VVLTAISVLAFLVVRSASNAIGMHAVRETTGIGANLAFLFVAVDRLRVWLDSSAND